MPGHSAVHMHASADFVVVLLAILKAGCAYVILDPDAPLARSSFIIDDADAALVLLYGSAPDTLRNGRRLE